MEYIHRKLTIQLEKDIIRRNTISQVLVSHKSKTGRIIKRPILFTFVETSGEMCQEVIRPLAVFHFPSPLSLFEIENHAAVRSLCAFAFRERGGSIQKGKNAERLFFFLLFTFTRGATFRSPDFATRSLPLLCYFFSSVYIQEFEAFTGRDHVFATI